MLVSLLRLYKRYLTESRIYSYRYPWICRCQYRARKGRWTTRMLESVKMLVGVVRSDTAKSHAMVFGRWSRCGAVNRNQSLTPRCHSSLAWSWRLPEQLPLGFAKACCRWMGPLDDLTACIVSWIEANHPSLSSASFLLFSDSRSRIADIRRSSSVLCSVRAKVQLFQSFHLCSTDIDVHVVPS